LYIKQVKREDVKCRTWRSTNGNEDSSSSSSSSDSSSNISLGSSSDSLLDSSSVHSLGCGTSGLYALEVCTIVYSLPPMTSESSLDSSSERSLDSSLPFAGRSHNPLLLWFRDSYSSEDSREEHMEIGTADVETVADLGISDEVGAHIEDGIGVGVEVATSDIKEDEEEFKAKASAGGTMEIIVDPLATNGISESTGGDAPDLEGTLYDIPHYMPEVPLDRIIEFETA
ncbi:hypothetical protein Tco_1118244, partial [Tanacetum coccineum]